MRALQPTFLAALAAIVFSGTAVAQVPPRTRGVIVSIDGDAAVIGTPTGRLTAHILPETRFAGARKSSLDDIKANSYIGTAAVPARNGTLRALEVTIFPDAMRGTGEGSYPWDLGRSGSMTNGAVSSMTNGTVSSMASKSSMTNGTVSATSGGHGRTIQVSYKGGVQTVALPASIPVVSLEPGDRTLLTPGAKVVVFGPVSGETIEARQIVVGVDGVRPPM